MSVNLAAEDVVATTMTMMVAAAVAAVFLR